ncbi:hypothetical protein [Actinomadura flavalba]|uniref:hypothetical protein n=1 Tax=Actinomadura flavalba TaxID=1120938 RepID=UPI000371313C|nr:hypothetical protein [Actinomadura flavalba]
MEDQDGASPRHLALAALALPALAAAATAGPVPHAASTRPFGFWADGRFLGAALARAAVVAGLVLIRRWPWTLLAGAVLTVPSLAAPHVGVLAARRWSSARPTPAPSRPCCWHGRRRSTARWPR